MQISGEYGTELLLRYTEEQFLRDLERRRVGDERRAAEQSHNVRSSIRARLSAILGTGASRMPAGREALSAGVSQVSAAHR